LDGLDRGHRLDRRGRRQGKSRFIGDLDLVIGKSRINRGILDWRHHVCILLIIHIIDVWWDTIGLFFLRHW
jgi:hypothetical protein